jgi:hypothetical protein
MLMYCKVLKLSVVFFHPVCTGTSTPCKSGIYNQVYFCDVKRRNAVPEVLSQKGTSRGTAFGTFFLASI